jgi:ribonuclease BN (tRNA processing enzyme)
MKVKFWGVRGSIPVPGEKTTEIGGNTSCIEVLNEDKELLIIDAGTGIKNLGDHIVSQYMKEGINGCHILLSHTHWDHIQGFPFFTPSFIKDFSISVYGPCRRNETLQDIMGGQMNYPYYPIKLGDLKAKIEFLELSSSRKFRIECDGKIMTTLFDHEIYRNVIMEDNPFMMDELKLTSDSILHASRKSRELNEKIFSFIHGSDLVVCDAHFTEKEYYNGKQGWGHGPVEFIIRDSKPGFTKNLVLFHHAPYKSDEDVRIMYDYLKDFAEISHQELNLIIGREGLELNL